MLEALPRRPYSVAISPLAQEVQKGMSKTPKRLPPKLFYDSVGSALFEQITELPEYYVTRVERAIFETHAEEIIRQAGNNLALVELGAGSANKTRTLIHALCRSQIHLWSDLKRLGLSFLACAKAFGQG